MSTRALVTKGAPSKPPRTEVTVPLKPTDRVSAWVEFAMQQGRDGEAFRHFCALGIAHNWLREHGYLTDDMGAVQPTDDGRRVLEAVHGYEVYRTQGRG